ncbi:MAG: hypothetical protein A2270_05715 [Elusimicrobia bacterium RIFOXYA12_FULL_51_18]|nr:MAG: hypothetical protein A2270_05715 [Elusimicrobia bacterium RIFOXYA12_FULL_51_18]OGS33129.1 MAG: hypothetical protein A2218_06735 [Elusimicrobia bacterium RIFOXYA2_FULL_53_38]
MKIIKRLFSVSFSVLFLVPVFAQTDSSGLQPSPDINPFLDPAVQDYVEMAYGYRNPKNTHNVANGFRDAPTSITGPTLMNANPAFPGIEPLAYNSAAAPFRPAAKPSVTVPAVKASVKPVPGQYYKVTFANENGPISSYVSPLDPNALSGFRAGDYVFIMVLPRTDDHAAVITALSGTGFKFAGEKTSFTGSGKKTFLLGWAPYSNLEGIYKNPKVRRVAIEKKASGLPFRTRIRFTLRAPGGERSGAFVSDFIRQLTSASGFASERVFRLPQNSGNAKFTAFEITGSLPVDMVGTVSRSPFVAAVEFNDKSL